MIVYLLFQTFQDRVRSIMDFSQNSLREDNSELINKLDNMERCLFQIGQEGLLDFQRWKSRESERICTSDIVINHKKRKRAALDT